VLQDDQRRFRQSSDHDPRESVAVSPDRGSTCSAFDELRDYFRVKRRGQPHVSLADQRQIFIDRWRLLAAEVAAV